MSTEAMHPQSRRNVEDHTLFPLPEPHVPPAAATAPGGRPRVNAANRHQVVMRAAALDELLSDDHRARVVWDYVEGLDLGPLCEPIRAVDGRPGRDATDPKILMALWLYATLDAVGSARQLDRLCTDHLAYQWICGGVPMNYHTLSDFRTAHVEFLNDLLTRSVAVLVHEGLVTMERVALDGMRVRASAGSGSFRRRMTLEACQAEAAEQWRQRMGAPEGKEIYKDRASTAECVNAISRNRGMQRFLVRGLRKVKAVVLWFALAHNLMRAASLRRQMVVAVG